MAQNNGIANEPSGSFIRRYQEATGVSAALYNGKVSIPYVKQATNHPYFQSANHTRGKLCYNRVVYEDILLRIDLFRDEVTVMFPDLPHRIVLDNAKIQYAIVHGATFVVSDSGSDANQKLLVLLHNGSIPVFRRYRVTLFEETMSFRSLTRSFKTQMQCAVGIDGEFYTVKNKNALFKLFPDRKKELNEYAKLHKLNFKKQLEQAVIDLVEYYETLTGGTQITQI